MHSDSLHTDNNWNNWFHFQYDRLWPVNMTGKTKGWLVNSPISPDIVRWPAVISSPGHWVLVRPRESNPRPFTLQSNALPTKLTLGRLGRVGGQVLVTIKTGLHWGLSPFGSWEREHCTDRGWNWNAEVYFSDLVYFLSPVSVWFLLRDFRLIELFSSRQRWVKSNWFGKRCIYPLLTNPRIVYFLSWLVIIFSCSS